METNYAYKMMVIYGDIKPLGSDSGSTHIETLPFAKLILYGQNVAVLKETAYNLFTTYCKASNKPKGQYWVELYIEKLNISNDDEEDYDFYQKEHTVKDYEYFDSDEGEIEYSNDEKKTSYNLFNLPPSVTKAMRVIASHYGFRTQTDQLSEEVGELLVALNKMKRQQGFGQPLRDEDNASLLSEMAFGEIADVLVMCYEVAALLNMKGNFEEKLKDIICAKTERTLLSAAETTENVVIKDCLSALQKEAGELQ